MEDKKNMDDSFSEVKICKPVPVRLCPKVKKSLKSSLSSSTSTVNSETSMNIVSVEEAKIDFENITEEEIKTDFFIFAKNLEEELCHDELYDIMNGSSSDQEKGERSKNNCPKVKRCEKQINLELDLFKSSFFDEITDDFNGL